MQILGQKASIHSSSSSRGDRNTRIATLHVRYAPLTKGGPGLQRLTRSLPLAALGGPRFEVNRGVHRNAARNCGDRQWLSDGLQVLGQKASIHSSSSG